MEPLQQEPSETALNADQKFGHAIVANENGEPVALMNLWQDRPAILIFLRHFACIACRAHAREVWNHREEYEKNGARVHFIGNGSPAQIAKFRTEMYLTGAPIYTDPGLVAFSSAGFNRSFMGTFGPSAIKNLFKLSHEGYYKTRHQPGDGDRLQLGGVVVVVPTGEVRYHFASTAVGHFPAQSDQRYIAGAASGGQAFTLESVKPVLDIRPVDYSRR